MATYFMFGNYSQKSKKNLSAKRTDQTIALIKEHGGKLDAGYALLGEVDLLLKVDFPDNQTAMKASVALSKMLGIGFTTAPAVTFEEFDKLTK